MRVQRIRRSRTRITVYIMIIDSHIHLFNRKVVSNVSGNIALVKRLKLQTAGAYHRTTASALEIELKSRGVDGGLLLPTAGAKNVEETNDVHIDAAKRSTRLHTAGTLHPFHPNIPKELQKLQKNGIRGIKLCTFSQGFTLRDPKTRRMFNLISMKNKEDGARFFVILDTFYLAHQYFGTPRKNTTTPGDLNDLIQEYPRINFIAAHMGGLAAPFDEIRKSLAPSKNLYLDTSNAAHTLGEQEFIHLLKMHGSKHVLFGTDWPWFGHIREKKLIQRLLDMADFSQKGKDRVFAGNIAELLELDTPAL